MLALPSATVGYYGGSFVLGGRQPAVLWLVVSVIAGAAMGTVGGLSRENAPARPWTLAGIAAILAGEGFALTLTAPSSPLVLDGGAYVIYPGTPVFLTEAVVGLLVLAASLRQPSPRALLATGTSLAVIGLVVASEVTTGLVRRFLAL